MIAAWQLIRHQSQKGVLWQGHCVAGGTSSGFAGEEGGRV